MSFFLLQKKNCEKPEENFPRINLCCKPKIGYSSKKNLTKTSEFFPKNDSLPKIVFYEKKPRKTSELYFFF